DALQRARTAEQGAIQERQQAEGHFYHALVGEARALRIARLGGYRRQVWDRLRRAPPPAPPRPGLRTPPRAAGARPGGLRRPPPPGPRRRSARSPSPPAPRRWRSGWGTAASTSAASPTASPSRC